MIRIGSILIALVLTISANVTATVSSTSISKGDSVTLRITASGEEIRFPKINKIDKYRIERRSSSTSIRYINGTKSKQQQLILIFTPTSSMTIPSYNITIDNKIFKTDKIAIKVDDSGACLIGQTNEKEFQYIMKVDKKEAYIGEPIALKLQFKRAKNAELLDIDFYEPKFNDFWAKKVGKEKQYSEGNYNIYELDYLLYPQKSGDIKVESNRIKIAVGEQPQSSFGFAMNIPSYKYLYSNELNFKIKPLPQGVELIGDFKIEAIIDKNEITAGQPVQFTLTIQGEGNIDDIQAQNIKIKDTVVYADKPVKTDTSFSQSFAIIGSSDFRIEPITIKYFNLKHKKVEKLITKAFDIKVLSSAISQNQNNTNQETTQYKAPSKIESMDKMIYFISGVIATILSYFLINYIKHQITLRRSDNSQTSDKELLKQLMPYIEHSEAEQYIKEYEEFFYGKSDIKPKKKDIYKFLKGVENI